MRKALWSSAALVLLLSGATLLWGAGAQAATSTVTMGSDAEPNAFRFFPAEITIPVGTTVRWQNKSDIPHDAVAENGSFESEQLSKGGTFEHTFTTPGDVAYICTVPGHKDAGMKAVVKVTGGAAAPAPAAPPPTTAPPPGGTTPTTAASAGQSATTTTKPAAGGSTTTTTAGAGVTATTQAPSVTPTSAPETAAGVTTTTAESHSTEAAAADDHASGGASKKKEEKSSPIGIAFAGVSTVLLAGISGKLLTSKS